MGSEKERSSHVEIDRSAVVENQDNNCIVVETQDDSCIEEETQDDERDGMERES